MEKKITLNIKDIALLKSNPEEYYKKQMEQDIKSYSGKPHLQKLPYDRRTNDPDKLKERMDKAKEEYEKMKDESDKIGEELEELYKKDNPMPYERLAQYGGSMDKEEAILAVEDYLRDNDYGDEFDRALDDWYSHLTEDGDIDYFGDGRCDETGRKRLNRLINKLRKLPYEEGSDEDDERNEVIFHLMELQANNEKEFEELSGYSSSSTEPNPKIKELEDKRDQVDKLRDDYFGEYIRTRDKRDQVTGKK